MKMVALAKRPSLAAYPERSRRVRALINRSLTVAARMQAQHGSLSGPARERAV